ncbi:glucosamine--fructose-6-phosphate aminotransferase (isomerizing) [Arthrobacter pascens]|uniref:SIS domain-containing protein n=1 Tax=Arthrobacter pascens TaxID=1677 RepID=UPI002857158F|nr:SIS domain-containing protein [Arthrobacter pascens]MDR6557552.1 glucosamine--fructose-6-phosphate aminotransferase (isomerizing) [Arthrobacter pascens]
MTTPLNTPTPLASATELPGSLMAAEILEQPEALTRQLDQGQAAIRRLAAELRDSDIRYVLLAARGTSDHAALYAKYLIETVLGLPAGLASPSSLTVYGAEPRMNGVLWLAVSQSGGSPDLVDSTAAAARAGAVTVAVTNAPSSPLAAAARHHVDILAGPERAVAATKSYTSQLLALWLLIDAWAGGDGADASVLPRHAADALARPEILEVANRYRFVNHIITTGRGFSYPTAREAALKLMETSYLAAHAFSGADLLHGPFAMIDEDRPVIAIASQGAGGRALQPVLERLAERGADVCLVGDPASARPLNHAVPLPQVPEQLAPILEILPLQRLAHAIAAARHRDPDAPRGLRKITETW